MVRLFVKHWKGFWRFVIVILGIPVWFTYGIVYGIKYPNATLEEVYEHGLGLYSKIFGEED